MVPAPPDDTALRVRIAEAEAHRRDGVAELAELARSSDRHARELALRGLARVGGELATQVIDEAARDPEPRIAAAARDAASVLHALAEPTPVPLSPDARAKLVEQMGDADVGTRISATRALGREVQPQPDPQVTAAFIARLGDGDPEVRAAAISGLAKHDAVVAARGQLVAALHDRDWRVAVEAVRALVGPHGDDVDGGRDAVIAALPAWLDALAGGDDPAAQVVIEALHLFVPHGANVPVSWQQVDPRIAPLARGWIECLAAAALRADVEHCGHGQLPEHLRLSLLAELVEAGAADATWRRATLRTLLTHADPRVRAAGVGALAATWKDGDATDHRGIVGTLVAALAAGDVIGAGAAVEAASAIDAGVADGNEADRELRAPLDAALVERATSEQDPELSASLFEWIGKQKLVTGAEACRAGLTAHRVRAKAAAECLRLLGMPVDTMQPTPPVLPPVDVTSVINASAIGNTTTLVNRQLHWRVSTTRGDIVIALRPDIAPWNVATIVTLARRGFFDGTELHRVVPGFVVQGGDPTGSGTGGPGFVVPAEPTAGDHFIRGAVGIADAGPDSGGSQFFIMQARAPHLDGRYTYIGDVIAGQTAADSLLVGDWIVRTTIE